jgi:cobalt-zinc-cadmium efflux system outer membrane protein
MHLPFKHFRVRLGRAGLPALVLVLFAASAAQGQGPQVDIDNPPGSSEGRGTLGPSLGASGTSGFDVLNVSQQPSIFAGRPGPTATRAPLNQLSAPTPAVVPQTVRFKPVVLERASVPAYGDLELSAKPEDAGPPNGMTLEDAINRLVQANLSLLALRYEIPMAQADVLTASLRNNPIFYGDGQLVPYGHYSNARPGGQTQYDVNLTFPLDVWRKRRARTRVFEAAQRVTEAQLQDAVRLQVDNLYTAYVDVVAARETLRYSETYALGIQRLLTVNQELLQKGQIKPTDVDAILAQLEQAQLQVHEASQAIKKTKRTLGLLLTMSREECEKLEVRSLLRDVRPIPLQEDELIRTGLDSRPDLAANRLGLSRAEADVKLAYANRFSDVYLLYQPYTYQFNGPFGLKSAYSYAVGVTVTAPIFNRNQGNIQRTKLNVTQTQLEIANQERQVAYDVEEAVREFQLSLNSVRELEAEVVPASRKVRDSAYRRWQGGAESILDYLEAQKDYNEVVKHYRDELVRHRRAMLDLNTAVGTRVLP